MDVENSDCFGGLWTSSGSGRVWFSPEFQVDVSSPSSRPSSSIEINKKKEISNYI